MKPLEASQSRWSKPLEGLLCSYEPLEEAQLELVRSRLDGLTTHAADTLPFGPNQVDGRALVIASGWAGAICDLEDGRRQIVAIFLPGDVVGPPCSAHGGMEVVALTDLRTAEANDLLDLLSGKSMVPPPLATAWRRQRRAAEARLGRHVVRLGRMSAYERTADLFLELDDRLRRAGLGVEHGIDLPLTQETLAAYLGLSAVHMNRMLQQLRRDRMITFQGGRMVILSPERLAQVTSLPNAL